MRVIGSRTEESNIWGFDSCRHSCLLSSSREANSDTLASRAVTVAWLLVDSRFFRGLGSSNTQRAPDLLHFWHLSPLSAHGRHLTFRSRHGLHARSTLLSLVEPLIMVPLFSHVFEAFTTLLGGHQGSWRMGARTWTILPIVLEPGYIASRGWLWQCGCPQL